MALQLDQAHDPLMREPLSDQLRQGAPRKLQLYAEAMPRKDFVVRQEEFGFLLVNRSRVLAVDRAAESLLDLLDGAHSLRAIEQQFGQEGLDFVGLLYQAGLVCLV
jgi:hypothetical protein